MKHTLFYTAIVTIVFTVDSTLQNFYGTLDYADGSVYVGEFIKAANGTNVAHGSGTYYYSGKHNGTVFESDNWNHGVAYEGSMNWTSGPFIGYKYVGEFGIIQAGTNETAIWTDGTLLFEGQGSVFSPRGEIVTGTRKQGELQNSNVTIHFSDGYGYYVGDVITNDGWTVPHGSGIYYYTGINNGTVLQSDNWNYRKPVSGNLTWTSGPLIGYKYIGEFGAIQDETDDYDCIWTDGYWLFEGQGSFETPSGSIYAGTWKQGKLIE